METLSQKEESYVGNWKFGLYLVGENPPWSENVFLAVWGKAENEEI